MLELLRHGPAWSLLHASDMQLKLFAVPLFVLLSLVVGCSGSDVVKVTGSIGDPAIAYEISLPKAHEKCKSMADCYSSAPGSDRWTVLINKSNVGFNAGQSITSLDDARRWVRKNWDDSRLDFVSATEEPNGDYYVTLGGFYKVEVKLVKVADGYLTASCKDDSDAGKSPIHEMCKSFKTR